MSSSPSLLSSVRVTRRNDIKSRNLLSDATEKPECNAASYTLTSDMNNLMPYTSYTYYIEQTIDLKTLDKVRETKICKTTDCKGRHRKES